MSRRARRRPSSKVMPATRSRLSPSRATPAARSSSPGRPVHVGPGRKVEGLGLLDDRLERLSIKKAPTSSNARRRLAQPAWQLPQAPPCRRLRPLPPHPRPEERAHAEHAFRRHLLLQGPALIRPLGQGRPQADLRGEGRHRRHARRLVRRHRGLRQAPLAPLLLELFQSPAGLAHGLEPLPDPPGDRAARRPQLQAVSEAAPRRGPVRRRLPRPEQEPEGVVLHHRLGARPGEEARGPPHHRRRPSATSS